LWLSDYEDFVKHVGEAERRKIRRIAVDIGSQGKRLVYPEPRRLGARLNNDFPHLESIVFVGKEITSEARAEGGVEARAERGTKGKVVKFVEPADDLYYVRWRLWHMRSWLLNIADNREKAGYKFPGSCYMDYKTKDVQDPRTYELLGLEDKLEGLQMEE
jgi:hypothetical protein